MQWCCLVSGRTCRVHRAAPNDNNYLLRCIFDRKKTNSEDYLTNCQNTNIPWTVKIASYCTKPIHIRLHVLQLDLSGCQIDLSAILEDLSNAYTSTLMELPC